MHCFLVAIGSMGDNLPFFAVGRALAARGHRVTMLASGYFRDAAAKSRLELIEIQSAERYMEFVEGQRSWSGLEALDHMAAEVIDLAPKVYEVLRDAYVPGETVVAAQGYAFGARFAQEKHGVPLATVHLQPMWLRSSYGSPGALGKLPVFVSRGLNWLMDRIVDSRFGRPLNELRASLDLPPVASVMNRWWNSPDKVIGLFPDWYNAPKPDWPPNTVLTGFPLEKEDFGTFDLHEAEQFLAAGEPPIVFSQSSITSDADYYRVSLEVADRLGRRAILLTPFPELIPSSLPSTARHFRFVPLGWLLPRAAAHVHHGGIGTIAHSIAAGIPQLTVPMVYDQTDNSLRLAPLGISEFLFRRQYTSGRAAKALERMLGSEEFTSRCREYSERIRRTEALARACQELESLAPQASPASAKAISG